MDTSSSIRHLLENERILSPRQLALLRRIAAYSENLGLPLYIVGGFVRDLLLERPVNDFDLVVEGDAIKLARSLAKLHGGKVTAHPSFGTATWFLPPELARDSGALDFATARTETYQRPGALPTVKPATIAEDLHRRDFSINAMALRLDGDHFGELLDPLKGQRDLARGRIRVLHPCSFVDDPTRLLRAIRYARRYDFQIESGTVGLINDESRAVLSQLSGERLRHEFDLIFDEPNAISMLEEAADLGLLSAVDATLPIPEPGFAALLDSRPAPALGLEMDRRKLGYLLWFMDMPAKSLPALRGRLAFTADLAKSVFTAAALLADVPVLADASPSEWTFRLDKVPPLSVYAVYLRTTQPALEEYLAVWRHIQPRITGDDLRARGLPPGPRYRHVLWHLRAAWLDGEVRNDKEEAALLESLM